MRSAVEEVISSRHLHVCVHPVETLLVKPKNRVDKFLNLFTAIVCGDKVKKNKPHPDPYVTACRELGVIPKESIVIENAPFGVESAVSAGCYCIGVTSTCEPSTLSKAHELIPKISDILKTEALKSSFSG